MTRYSFKVGVGLVSVALGAGTNGSALAQSRTEFAFALAMAQYQADNPASMPVTASATAKPAAAVAATANGRQQADLPGPDGLVPGSAYVEADQIVQPDTTQFVATGHVQMRYKDKIIRADKITYNSQTDITVAEGHTQTINDDGSIQYSDRITYSGTEESGSSENFAAIDKDNAKVFARRVDRVNDYTTRLTNIIYTPCELCRKHGTTTEPSWSIQASQITQRKDKKMVFYNNAIIKLQGVPVLYTPYMWTPDPELARASGFLTPKLLFSRKRGGFSYEQPYLWSISPYSALIISPQFNAGINPLLNMEFDRHFYSGEFRARFGFTNETMFGSDGKRTGTADSRDYLLADGAFKINEDWRWSFTAQHVKDRSGFIDRLTGRPYNYANFFERYSIDNAFDQVGEWTADSRELINQFHLTRQTPTSYVSLSMANFQSLAVAGFLDPVTGLPFSGTTTRTDVPFALSSGLYPVMAPMIEAYWSPDHRFLGGQATLSLDGLILKHKIYLPSSGAPPLADTNQSPYDTARLSVGASWYGHMTTGGGLVWGPFVDLRHDEYHETNLDTTGQAYNVSRDLSTVGLDLSYPLVRRMKAATMVLEPIAQLAISPDAQTSPYLPTEDSQSLEFDTTTLFRANKSPGFDIYEGGRRLNLGLHSQLKFDSGLQLDGLIGRTLRDKPEAQFLRNVVLNGTTYSYDPSGLGRQNSDWVADASFDTGKGLYGYTRLRMDSDTFRLAQGEWGLSVVRKNTEATARYIFNDILAVPTLTANGKLQRFGDNYRDFQLYGRHFFTKNWGIAARLDRDLVADTWRRSTVSAIYRNDCIWYELVYQRNQSNLYAHNGKPTSTIFFRLNFPTLTKSNSDFTDVR
ncbi:LPS-assembly protein LptD [Asticcacaulis solisilvae]|uniref:LPS-assembly protein LptD n=1 Tax=Asticcacaulis solisilvae TaxID=1217274 RepID=UPI003FD86FCA